MKPVCKACQGISSFGRWGHGDNNDGNNVTEDGGDDDDYIGDNDNDNDNHDRDGNFNVDNYLHIWNIYYKKKRTDSWWTKAKYNMDDFMGAFVWIVKNISPRTCELINFEVPPSWKSFTLNTRYLR